MNLRDVLLQILVAFIRGIFGFPDEEDLKPERIQFWKNLISEDWKEEGDGVALLRTIVHSDRRMAGDMGKILAEELETCGYTPDALDTVGNVVSLRLTTASVGKLTESDYAAAALIDLIL